MTRNFEHCVYISVSTNLTVALVISVSNPLAHPEATGSMAGQMQTGSQSVGSMTATVGQGFSKFISRLVE